MRLIDADAIIEKKWQAESEACFYALEDVVSVTDIEEAPTIEVSEDCISREYILGEAFMSDEYNRETKSFDLPVVSVRDIEDAPSVVPTTEQSSKVEELLKDIEDICKDIRERHVDDSVCGLCEYDADHGLDGHANECPGFERDDCFKLSEEYKAKMKGAEDE